MSDGAFHATASAIEEPPTHGWRVVRGEDVKRDSGHAFELRRGQRWRSA